MLIDWSQKELLILAFDHRTSFLEKMFGIKGRQATLEEKQQIEDYRKIVFEGFRPVIRKNGKEIQANQIFLKSEKEFDKYTISAKSWFSYEKISIFLEKIVSLPRLFHEPPKEKGLNHDCYSHFQNCPLPPKFQACRPSTLRIRITDPLRCASTYLDSLFKPVKKMVGKDIWMIFTRDLKNILKESKPCYTRFPLNCRISCKNYWLS
jgi:hypothetical protein